MLKITAVSLHSGKHDEIFKGSICISLVADGLGL